MKTGLPQSINATSEDATRLFRTAATRMSNVPATATNRALLPALRRRLLLVHAYYDDCFCWYLTTYYSYDWCPSPRCYADLSYNGTWTITSSTAVLVSCQTTVSALILSLFFLFPFFPFFSLPLSSPPPAIRASPPPPKTYYDKAKRYQEESSFHDAFEFYSCDQVSSLFLSNLP
jgi:hypothetical protein